jgi:hypothetical protein
MSTRKHKEKETKRLARLQSGKVLAGVAPAPSKEDIAKQMMKGIDTAISDVRNLLAQADRILTRHRCAGLVAGLKAGATNSSAN